MAKLKDISYETDFYWKGRKYKQLIRPKSPKGSYSILCMIKGDYAGVFVEMPSGRQVKPIIRV